MYSLQFIIHNCRSRGVGGRFCGYLCVDFVSLSRVGRQMQFSRDTRNMAPVSLNRHIIYVRTWWYKFTNLCYWFKTHWAPKYRCPHADQCKMKYSCHYKEVSWLSVVFLGERRNAKTASSDWNCPNKKDHQEYRIVLSLKESPRKPLRRRPSTEAFQRSLPRFLWFPHFQLRPHLSRRNWRGGFHINLLYPAFSCIFWSNTCTDVRVEASNSPLNAS